MGWSGARMVAAAGTTVMLAACGGSGPGASTQSPTPATASARPSPASSPTPAPAEIRLVIEDFPDNQVRLARLDARDTAKVAGKYEGIVAGHVIVLNGRVLESVDHNGTVRRLGQLAPSLSMIDAGRVAVNPDLSRWVYTLTDDKFITHVHLGTPTTDSEIVTLPPPDVETSYTAFVWNASGVYFTKQPTGLGGAGPFLEYHFLLAKFDVSARKVTIVAPACVAYAVLDDGTMICGASPSNGRMEVRSPSGQTHSIQLTIGGSANDYIALAFSHVTVSPDGRRLIAARDGAKDPVVSYQMAVADLTASSASPFGPLDYLPDAWLPDGRLVADHLCVQFEGAGPCNATLNGTYIFSADGTSHSLFYRLQQGAAVVGYI